MACYRPKCVEARKRAQLKAGRGVTSTQPEINAQPASDNTNQPAPSAQPQGVVVSSNNKKGIVQ